MNVIHFGFNLAPHGTRFVGLLDACLANKLGGHQAVYDICVQRKRSLGLFFKHREALCVANEEVVVPFFTDLTRETYR